MTLMQAQREREAAPRSGALRRSLSRPSSRVGAPAVEAALLDEIVELSGIDAAAGSAGKTDDPSDNAGASVSADALNKCAPDRALRFAFPSRRGWRDWATGCLLASLMLHGGVVAAVWMFQPLNEPMAGAEEAIPIEFVISGSDADRNASQEGAQAEQVDILPPDLPEVPPVDIAQELPKVDVPPPPDAPPVDIAQESPTAFPPPPLEAPAVDKQPPAVTTIDLPPLPDAPLLADLTPPALAGSAEDAVPPVHALPKPVEAAKEPPEQPKPVAPKPVAARPEPRKPEPRKPEPRKVEPKKIEPRQVAARPAQEKPAPRAAPVEASATLAPLPGRGRGQAGSGESDQNRVASTRGGAAAVAGYRAKVIAHLQRFKVYPEAGRDRGIEGRPVVSFALSRGGQVLSASLSKSSGASILDQATLAMVRRAAPFPAAPDDGPSSSSFNVLINYNLR